VQKVLGEAFASPVSLLRLAYFFFFFAAFFAAFFLVAIFYSPFEATLSRTH
jgi:hypothetical protein